MSIKNSNLDALPTLDRRRYLEMAKAQGLHHAITSLHNELKDLELECFEGKKGYQPALFELMKQYRDFSRELWLLNVDHGLDVTMADVEKKRKF